VILLLIGFNFWSLYGQDTRDRYQLSLKKTTEKIIIDGQLNEPIWQNTELVDQMMNHWPIDTGAAQAITHVKMTYDEHFIYISAVCYDNGKRIIQSLKRDDSNHWQSDNFNVAIDPINQRTNGFIFATNAGGAQYEGMISVRGNDPDIDTNWDNKWYSEVKQFDDRWVVEMAIPFKSLRYNSSNTTWGINFIRSDMENNVFSTWTQFPLNYAGIDFGYNGVLQWDEAPKQSKGKVVLIPYISGGISKDHEENESTSYNSDIGLDAKIALTSSLNLDLTVNPDFSNVDVDQQVTNLSRFSLFFPEKRNFFLENSDIFSNFGTWQTRPFFSRRIGLDGGVQIPILYGVRLSGNLTDDTRIGIMDVQTRSTDELEAQNYAIAAIQNRVLKRSIIKGFVANRQASVTDENGTFQDYNRVGGLEFDYLSNNGNLGGSVKYHHSTTDEKLSDRGSTSGEVYYNVKRFFTGFNFTKVGENFITDMGFTPRLNNYDAALDTTVRIGYNSMNPWIGFNFYPKSGSKVNMHGPRTWTVWTMNKGGEFNERRTSFVYFVNFADKSEIRVDVQNKDVKLPFETDLLGEDNITFLPAERYQFTDFGLRYESDPRKVLSVKSAVRYGDFFSGTKLTFSSTVNFRQQPWGNFGVSYTQNKVDLGGEFGSTNLHLIGPTAQISFSNAIFWTSFLQYNTQAENFNLNSRFQWRFKSMSDLFIVYSENYTTTNFNVKNRGLVFKLTYWFNV